VARTAWDLVWILLWQDRGADALAVAEQAERVVPDEATRERARVLAIVGACCGWLGDYATFLQRSTEAHVIAQRLADQHPLGQVLALQTNMYWNFLKVRQTVDAGRDGVEASRAAGDVWDLASTLTIQGFGLGFSGAPEEARRAADEAEQLAVRVGYDGAAANAGAVRTMATAMLSGELGAVERSARSIVDIFGRAGPWSFSGLILISMSRFWKGAWDEADRNPDEALALEPPEVWREWARGWRFVLQAYRGNRTWLDQYRHRHDLLFREGRTPFGDDAWFVIEAVEALAGLGERGEAHRLYSAILALMLMRDGFIANIGGPSEMCAGLTASAGAQWDSAELHFDTALRQAHDFPSKIGQPEVRRWYAWMLLDRDAPGDRDKARTFLGEAIELYQAIGMPKHVEIAERMLEAPRS